MTPVTALSHAHRPFELSLSTRGYEVDYTGTVPMPIVLRYFEFKRWEMMRDPRLGLAEAVHAGHFFVVREQVVEILRHIGQGVPLRLRTWFDHSGRISASVRHEAIRLSDGALIAQARVTGVWIGPNRRMARLPVRFRELAQAQAEALAGSSPGHGIPSPVTASTTLGGRRASFFDPPEVAHPALGLDLSAPSAAPPREAFRHPLTVPPRDLDVFSHVNAATWLTYCDDARVAGAARGALPASAEPRGYCVRAAVTYHREAVVDDRLTVHVWPRGDAPRRLDFSITDEDGRIMCAACCDMAAGAAPISRPA